MITKKKDLTGSTESGSTECSTLINLQFKLKGKRTFLLKCFEQKRRNTGREVYVFVLILLSRTFILLYTRIFISTVLF